MSTSLAINPRKRKAQSPAPRYGLRRSRANTYADPYEYIDESDFTDDEENERLNPSDEEADDEMASSSDEESVGPTYDHDEEGESAVLVGSQEEDENDSILTPDHESSTREEDLSSGEAEDGGSDAESPDDWDIDCGAELDLNQVNIFIDAETGSKPTVASKSAGFGITECRTSGLSFQQLFKGRK